MGCSPIRDIPIPGSRPELGAGYHSSPSRGTGPNASATQAETSVAPLIHETTQRSAGSPSTSRAPPMCSSRCLPLESKIQSSAPRLDELYPERRGFRQAHECRFVHAASRLGRVRHEPRADRRWPVRRQHDRIQRRELSSNIRARCRRSRLTNTSSVRANKVAVTWGPARERRTAHPESFSGGGT